MIRAALFFVLALTPAARGQEVAPPPRPAPGPGEPELPVPAADVDPAQLAERIVTNSQAAGDRLAKADAGTDTRARQDAVKKDIDALIRFLENPPPSPDPSQSNDPSNSQKQNPSGGQGGKQGMPQLGSKKNRQQPGGESQQQPGSGQQPKSQSGSGSKEDKKPQPGVGPMQLGGGPGAGGKSATALPLDEMFMKDVWGHLPDKTRQQMTQFYREQFLSRYGELLKQYYTALAEKERNDKR